MSHKLPPRGVGRKRRWIYQHPDLILELIIFYGYAYCGLRLLGVVMTYALGEWVVLNWGSYV